ncbi:histidine phosphatase family protein [Planococcus koreensis]|uniref:histidine phosphatase family protein n=1 Tax=Planococcus koreensis TaxID=112331 RepID=UPI0039FBA1DB
MSTFIYMVRHGESPKEGNERTRGLTEKGQTNAHQIAEILKAEEIDVVVSSPYIRSVLTVKKLAHQIGKEVLVFEDLKERRFSSEDNQVSDKELLPLLERSFLEPNYALGGGESNVECQKRAVKVLKALLTTYEEKKVVIGTHGAVMTLMMGFYDEKYDLNFLSNTSKPDIYKMEFSGHELVDVQRLWSESMGTDH